MMSQTDHADQTPIPCKALSASVFIDPSGDVYPCVIFNKKLGNIRKVEYDLGRIWRSDATKTVREDIVKMDCPHCWLACEAYQSILGRFLL